MSPPDLPPLAPSQQAISIGRAIRALRERAGITQERAGEAMGVRRQAIQNYEAGVRQAVLRTDVQDRIAAAIGVRRDDILREAARQAGEAGPERPPAATPFPTPSGYELPVLTRTRTGEDGPTLYGVSEPDAVIDMSWMFGSAARTLRMAGDRMSGYVESGQLVVYDLSVWPRRGEGCVIELNNGEVHVAEYIETGQGVLKARLRSPPEDLCFPMADVKGAYVIRFRGN